MKRTDSDWEVRLIFLFVLICEYHKTDLTHYCQRLSNNNEPVFTDVEVICIFIWGIMQKKKEIKDIYNYTRNHLFDYYPLLPSYQSYVARLNRVGEAFIPLIECIQKDIPPTGVLKNIHLIDSMPIILANEKRSSNAKVAREIANKTYCSSKNMWYHGVKVHILANRKPGTIPLPNYIAMSPASNHDFPVFEQIAPLLYEGELYADNAYSKEELEQFMKKKQNFILYATKKKKKGEKVMESADRLWSTAVSRVRQPIESLFNWIEQKTGIQVASKVRSYSGLMTHVWGRLAAAMFIILSNS